MQTQTIRKSRWFWPWQDEQEESWLRKMANNGFHLVKADYFGQYTFQSGEPSGVVYRLDYQDGSNKDKNAYLQLFSDSGWEHVGVLGGWQYFRKQVKTGDEDEIFTDKKSKIEKYGRLIGGMGTFLPVYILLLLNMDYVPGSTLGVILKTFGFAVMVLYAFVILKIAIRIDQLRKQNIKQ
jgi:hypothetical protein